MDVHLISGGGGALKKSLFQVTLKITYKSYNIVQIERKILYAKKSPRHPGLLVCPMLGDKYFPSTYFSDWKPLSAS